MGNMISTYQEFWPFYLRQHSSALCRGLHFAGTTLAIVNLALFLVTKSPLFLLTSLLCGYGPAWIGHFFIEKNRPATFKHPLWSLISDFRMYFMWLNGSLGKELKLSADKE